MSVRWDRMEMEMDLACWEIGFDRFYLPFDCMLPPRRSSGMEGGDTVTNPGLLGLVTAPLIAWPLGPQIPSS
jgi:hypothetical protein